MIKGELFRIITRSKYLFVKLSERINMILSCHCTVRHFRIQKTIEKIMVDYYWKSINFDITNYINNCLICQSKKRFSNTTSYKLIKPNFSWHTIFMDMIGPLGKSSFGYNYFIVAIDYLTKWIEICPVQYLGALTVEKFVMDQIIFKNSCTQFLLTDNGTNFTSTILSCFIKLIIIRVFLNYIILS